MKPTTGEAGQAGRKRNDNGNLVNWISVGQEPGNKGMPCLVIGHDLALAVQGDVEDEVGPRQPGRAGASRAAHSRSRRGAVSTTARQAQPGWDSSSRRPSLTRRFLTIRW